MSPWNELLTDLAWHDILHRHFRPLQNRKWLTAKWLTYGKHYKRWLCEEAWKPRSSRPILIYFEFRSKLHSLLSFAWTLTRPTNFNLLRQNIVFSHSERIPVSFSRLFHYFSFFCVLFYVVINFLKNYFIIIILLLLFF